MRTLEAKAVLAKVGKKSRLTQFVPRGNAVKTVKHSMCDWQAGRQAQTSASVICILLRRSKAEFVDS
jgi:hypothetical protein